MTDLSLVSIAFNRPKLISEQIRLFAKYLKDDHTLTIVDNSSEPKLLHQIMQVCASTNTPYVRAPTSKGQEHYDALNYAWHEVLKPCPSRYIGFVDHDLFPTTETTVVDKIQECGFYGIGQRHQPTDRLYLWPGFFWVDREWLGDRDLDFNGIRGEAKRDDGDTGSANWPLFEHEDWSRMFRGHFGYEAIRQPDDVGLQSWGVEVFNNAWLHMTNGSHWFDVPRFDEREVILMDRLAAL